MKKSCFKFLIFFAVIITFAFLPEEKIVYFCSDYIRYGIIVTRNSLKGTNSAVTFVSSENPERTVLPFLIISLVLLLAGLAAILILLIKNRHISENLKQIVDKRTTELAYQRSALMTIFDAIPDLIFCKDLNLNFTDCNKSFERHFGCSEKYLIGKNDESGLGLSKEIADRFRELDRKVIKECRTFAAEEIIPSANGEMMLFETLKTPLMQNGKPVGLMGISRDITRRKSAEESLQLTLDNLDTCIYLTEIETGKILFVNDKMKKEFGNKNFIGKVCWQVFQSGFTEQCEFCPVPKLCESGDDYLIWEEHNTVTGKHYRNTDSIIKWYDGRDVHMQHSVDITDMVKLQQELEDASKAKSDFLSRMSHEIRTPIGAIMGMNSIAMNTNDISKIHHCHERIENASKHLLGVINDILDMSKIEANKFELFFSEFNFEKMLMNITNVTSFKADEKKQNLVIKLHENIPPYLVSDEVRLSQVITNLLTNAIKFTPNKGTVVLSIEKTNEDGEDVVLKFIVEDNGIGISEEQQARLFSSFEQADGSISRRFGGTGLGLVISKNIVELMGGTVSLESKLGKGSKFVFTIKTKKGKEKKKAAFIPTIDRKNLRIMAVDDCLETREYFRHFMDEHKLPCDIAASGVEAIEKIKNAGSRPYNVFFVDWQMPEIDGIELTKQIKEITGDNSVVIMISVADWATIEKEALSAGVKLFVAKPLFPSTLIDTINSCLIDGGQKKDKITRALSYSIRQSYLGQKIMIAEDNEINREIIAAILEDTGLLIDFAENGTQAINMFKECGEEYSLIFMDIHMPETDGYQATRTIRNLEIKNAKNIPIIAMTANVFREDIEKCLMVGMNDHIGKPIDQAALFKVMNSYLKGSPRCK